MKKPILAALAAALAAGALPARAQLLTRPHLEWRTVRTEHFEVHYPAEMSAWTLDVVARLEAVHGQVAALVGYAPPKRVTLVVEDPSNQTNGFALPFLDQPTIGLWPTPPDPRSALGNNRDPAEQLAVHEFAHIAHLTRPTRNPRQNLLWSLAPVQVGPLARKAPRWVTEGYATYVEGRLTGSGRPHSVIRAAVLRQWALEGRLPTYGQLGATSGFYGGAMAYLAGSAYLEWLEAQRGDSSLVHLWRRLSARQERSFPDAFAGVYGGAPHELYGRFTVDVTERALQARRALAAAGLVVGDTVQRLSWGTGDPAVSRSGEHLATVLRGAPGTPSRVVVWRTADEPEDSAAARARRRLLERDPEDVPDIRWRPRAKKALATLLPVNGRGHDDPRFLPDGSGVLVTRAEPRADGATRPDLFVWRWREKGSEPRRVTRGAGIHSADPAPDGRSAAAVQCLNGVCALVRVDLASGAVTRLAGGTPDVVFYHPRYAPDGSGIAVSVQEVGVQRGRWRVALADATSGALRFVGPDDGASRYDAAWLAPGRLVLTSERGGVANLEVIDVATGAATPLTRVTGAALAPEPNPATGHVFYLSLHAGGLDLMRVHPDSARPGPVVALDPALTPAAPQVAAVVPDTLPRAPLPPTRAYGLGPRRTRLLLSGSEGADGSTSGIALLNGDPVGRLTWMARGSLGERDLPRGAALNAVWRGWLPAVGMAVFFMEHQPSRSDPSSEGFFVDPDLDASYRGGALYVETPTAGSALRRRLRVGGSAGAIEIAGSDARTRLLGFAEHTASLTRARGRQWLNGSLALHGSLGRTGEDDWRRGVATLGLGVGLAGLNVRAQGTYGRVNEGAPRWEHFVVGGVPQELFDDALVSQRLPMPAARFGVTEGRELLSYRVSTVFSGLTAYYWGASADPGHDQWYRLAGVEAATDISGLSIIRLPGIRLVTGVAYPLDAPDRHELRFYSSLTFRP